MSNTASIRAYAAFQARGELAPYEYKFGPLAENEVEIKVESCGICHSDLSVLNNEWGNSIFPLVPGHEVVGRVVALGENSKGLSLGDRVGVGWQAGCCHACRSCLGGDQNLCEQSQATIVGHYGGFAERVRCQWDFAFPLPEGLDAATAGPLFCGGITVFNPLKQFQVRPTSRVAVVGIGGLGHLALQFLNHWGCEVTAFTSNPEKHEEVKRLGAHHAVDSRDSSAMRKLKGRFDLILVTVNVPLDWGALIEALAPRGRLHFVGAVLKAVPVSVPQFIQGQLSLSASPIGSPVTIKEMLDFCALHQIAPVVERFPISKVNEAFERLRSGKARYRVVLDVENGF